MEQRGGQLRAALADGPKKRAASGRRARHRRARPGTASGCGSTWCAVPPSGTWDQRRGDLYGLAEDWVGPRPPVDARGRPGAARPPLPAAGSHPRRRRTSRAGRASPTAGPRRARSTASRPAGSSTNAAASWSTCRARPLPDPQTPAPIRFIGTFDAILMVHCRSTQVLPEAHRPRIFSTKTPAVDRDRADRRPGRRHLEGARRPDRGGAVRHARPGPPRRNSATRPSVSRRSSPRRRPRTSMSRRCRS